MNDLATNLNEKEMNTSRRIYKGLKNALEFSKSILYLTRKIFML